MAKYEIKFSCGHTATIQLVGKDVDRRRKIEYFQEKGICPTCYHEYMVAKEKQEQEQKTKGFSLCTLEGSEKQIKWAKSIRADFFEILKEHLKKIEGDDETKAAAIKFFENQSTASWWIDYRYEIYNPSKLIWNYKNEILKIKEGK